MQFTFTNLAVWLSQSDEDIGELSAFWSEVIEYIYAWCVNFVDFSTGVQWQFVRYHPRRINPTWPDPNPWRVPVYDKKHSLYQQELTKENEAFLEQTVLDRYQEKMKESLSPLKDGPWQRSEWTVG